MTPSRAGIMPAQVPPAPPAVGTMYASSSGQPPTAQAVAAPSGQGIALLPRDGSGTPTGVVSIAPPDEVQQVRLVATPSGNGFSLSFGGHATATIPTTTSPPGVYALYTFPSVAGHAYDLAVTAEFNTTIQAGWYFEAIAGGVVLARHAATGSEPNFADPGVATLSGNNPAPWTTVLSGVQATGSTMQLRFTSPAGVPMVNAALRVLDHAAGSAPAYFSVGDPNHATSVGYYGLNDGKDPNAYGGSVYTALNSTGQGPVVTVTPGGAGSAAAALQAALCALPSIGPAGVVVTDLTTIGTGIYDVTFSGPGLTNARQASMTCADPAVAIAEVNPGGTGPTLTINGAAPVRPTGWLPVNPAQALPYAYLALPQSAPAVQTFPACNPPIMPQGGYPGLVADPTSMAGLATFVVPGGGVTASWPLQTLPPGTYEYAITYNPAPFAASNTAYAPSSASQFTLKDGTGNTLGTYTVNQTVAPSDYQSGGRGYKVLGSFTLAAPGTLALGMSPAGLASVASPTSNNPQPVAIIDAFQVTRTSADASIVVGPGDVATLNVPANFLVAQAGPLPAMTIPVSPPSTGAILPPFSAVPKTMIPGYNVEAQGPYDNLIAHSNLACLASFSGNGATLNPDGYPTRLVTLSYDPGTAAFPLIVTNGEFAGLGVGTPWAGTSRAQDGLYTLSWDGDAIASLEVNSHGTTIVEQVGQRRLTGATGNRRVYLIASDKAFDASPRMKLQVASTRHDPSDSTGLAYFFGLTNLAIYPPDPADPSGMTEWAAPPYFHPWYVAKLAGMQSIRVMDVMNTNALPAATIAQYMPATFCSRSGPALGNYSCGVASVGPVAGGPWFPAGWTGPIVQVKTTAPHGLYDGAQVGFSGCGTAQFAGGQTATLDGPNPIGYAHVVDASTLDVALTVGPPAAMTNTLSGGSITSNSMGTAWPLEDIGRLAAQVPSLGHCHFNVSTCIDVTPGPGGGAYDVAHRLATTTPAGFKFSVEFGNECWNRGGPPNVWACLMYARQAGTSLDLNAYEPWYADRAHAVHQQFLAAFAAAGRPNDVIRLFGTQAGGPSRTDAILARCQSMAYPVDEVCVDVYESNCGSAEYTEAQVRATDFYTTGQSLDCLELNSVYGGWPAFKISDQFPALQQYGYGSAKVVGYEGSIADPINFDPPGTLFGSGNTPDYALRHGATRRHPRNYGVTLQMAQSFQDAGLARWEYFHIGESSLFAAWDTYEYASQGMGTGDPARDLANVNTPQAKNQVLSEVGGAWARWAGLVPLPAKKAIKPRNGTPLARGLAHGGLARTTRSR